MFHQHTIYTHKAPSYYPHQDTSHCIDTRPAESPVCYVPVPTNAVRFKGNGAAHDTRSSRRD